MSYSDPLNISGHPFQSRLLLGSARFPDYQTLIEAIDVSEAEIVTVSIRRKSMVHSQMDSLLQHLETKKIFVLPNTAGCYTVKEAVVTAQLAREALKTNWIKLELIGDEKTLYPDVVALLQAAEELIKDGFIVLAYCNDDPVTCQKLADLGCAAVMPLGSPIGSGMGILNPYNLQIIREKISIPVILDAGIGTASDAVKAMELGFDGVLINTAIAQAHSPQSMALAMKLAWQAGRLAYLAGRIAPKSFATNSSPIEGKICI